MASEPSGPAVENVPACATGDQCSPFSSRSVTSHLVRGALGLVLVVWALANAASHPLLAIAAAVSAVVAWRGCPMCWTIGLFETVVRRRGRA